MLNEERQIGRRNFLRSVGLTLAVLPAVELSASLLSGCAAGKGAASQPATSDGQPGNVSWQTVLTSKEEPGEPLIVSGRIFGPDGKTAVAGALIHVYHTDARGLYSEDDGNGREPNPRIKGWMKTNAEGRYEFRTIKPASYPGSRNPAHIHSKVSAPGYAERWIPEFWFEGDPFITADVKKRFEGAGAFSPIMAIKRDDDGTLRCTRDIKLEKV